MKVTSPLKYLSITALTFAIATGCATQPEQPEPEPEPEPAPEPAPEPEPTGPSEAEVDAALNPAREAVEEAKARGWIWKSTEDILQQAIKADREGRNAEAIELANKAKFEADAAENQYYLELGKMYLKDIEDYYSLTPEQQQRVDRIKQAVRNAEGRRVHDMAKSLLDELEAAGISRYTVERGDHLWGISSQRQVYGNPYQWPLIYKANSDKINDPDLIYPGQVFSIDRNPTTSEVNRAVDHAKSRGAWSLGVTEESDKAYLRGE